MVPTSLLVSPPLDTQTLPISAVPTACNRLSYHFKFAPHHVHKYRTFYTVLNSVYSQDLSAIQPNQVAHSLAHRDTPIDTPAQALSGHTDSSNQMIARNGQFFTFFINSIESFLSEVIYFLNQYTDLPFPSHILSILIQNQRVCCRAEKAPIPSYL